MTVLAVKYIPIIYKCIFELRDN